LRHSDIATSQAKEERHRFCPLPSVARLKNP
jgi:predicted ATPase